MSDRVRVYPVANAIKVVLHKAFRASTISQVTLANNFFKTSVLCAQGGFPVCAVSYVWSWLWIVSLYLYNKISNDAHVKMHKLFLTFEAMNVLILIN